MECWICEKEIEGGQRVALIDIDLDGLDTEYTNSLKEEGYTSIHVAFHADCYFLMQQTREVIEGVEYDK